MSGEREPDGNTLADVLRLGRKRLLAAGRASPGLDAEVLLRHVLGIDRTALFSRLRERIDPPTLAAYGVLLDERARGVPIAYLTGEREFMGLPLAVGPGVLVPRPETEILVEWAIACLRGRERTVVVDVGTGSGAIAVSVAVWLGDAWRGHVLAADVSGPALNVAARNRERFGLTRRVALVQGSLLDWLGVPVDLVLANLPYLRPDQIAENPELAAEPALALDGGGDGLGLIRPLLRDAPRVLVPGGALGIEIDPCQHDEVAALARQAFPRSRLTFLRDLAGQTRHAIVETVAAESGR